MIIQADYKKKEATITVTLDELGMVEDFAENWLLERHCRNIRPIYEGKK